MNDQELFNSTVGNKLNGCEFLVRDPTPDFIAILFIESITTANDADWMLTFVLFAAVTNELDHVHRFVLENLHCQEFVSFINTILNIWSLDATINMNDLCLVGQCVLETGFGSGNEFIDTYRKKIGCNSTYSIDFNIYKAPEKYRHSITNNRLIYSTEPITTAGKKILDHVKALK